VLSQLLFNFWTLCVFEPLSGGLGTTYDVHLGLIGKSVVEFLLVLIELFFARSYRSGATGKTDRKSAISFPRGQCDPKFEPEGDVPPIIFARIVRPTNASQLCRR